MSYKKPILVEFLVELRRVANLTDAGLLDLANTLRHGGWPELEIASQLEGAAQGGPFIPATRFRCWGADRKHLVQIAASVVVFNQVGEYLGWDDFKANMGRLLQVIGGESSFESVSLQTIDQFDVPLAEYQLGTYLVCGGEYIPGMYRSSSEPCDLSLGLGLLASGGFNRQLQLKVKPVGGKMRLRWHATFTDKLEGVAVGEKLETLHDESNKMFEAMITDETRRYMGGEA